jgi:Fe-S-cluster-containing dehydrogenase component
MKHALGADTWRHVAFIEEKQTADGDVRWLMSSDVCKRCTHAACLDVCPARSLFRTEFGTVVVQEDICNGCGYRISACPYGVIDQRKGVRDGAGSGGLDARLAALRARERAKLQGVSRSRSRQIVAGQQLPGPT